MFNVGDLIIGNNNNPYYVTNKRTLCIVGYVNPHDSNRINVFALEGDQINSSREIDFDSFDFSYTSSRCQYYDVDASCFEHITMEEWKQFKKDKEEEIVFTVNSNYDAIINYFNIKGDKIMTTPATPAINLEGNYVFTNENKKYAIETMAKIMDEYDHPNSKRGLEKIWEEFKRNKSGLAYLLSMHPNWDADVMGIVLENSYSRSRDEEVVKGFCRWCKRQLKDWAKKRQYKINCCTIHELYQAKDRLENIKYKMEVLREVNGAFSFVHNVTFDGMTYNEICSEYSRITEIFNKGYTSSNYIGNNIYVNEDVYNKFVAANNFIDLILNYNNHLADDDFATKVNRYATPFDYEKKGKTITFGAVAGQKVSRIVSKFFKNYDFDKIVDMQTDTWYDDNGVFHSRDRDHGWNKRFAEFADAINPLNIKRWTIISVNPVDYLTMSFGNGWASCHTPDKENKRRADGNYSGCYCSGTLSYMLDKPTLIMYTVNEKYKGREFCLQDKMNRCNFHIGEDKFIQGRLYPDGRDAGKETSMAGQFRAVMQKVLTECVKEANLWKVLKGTGNCCRFATSAPYATNYPDWTHYDDCNVSLLKREEDTNNTRIIIGHTPICPCCGDTHTREEYLACYDCTEEGNFVECAHCSSRINLDNGDYIFDEDTENYYCDEYCANQDDCYYCDNVNEWHSEWVYEDENTNEHFYDYWGENCIHFMDSDGIEHHFCDEENAYNNDWVYIEEEWYNTHSDDVIQCPHCGDWTLADHEECLQCGAIIEDEDELDETA